MLVKLIAVDGISLDLDGFADIVYVLYFVKNKRTEMFSKLLSVWLPSEVGKCLIDM